VTATWTLRGFDRRTEFVACETDIPGEMLEAVRGIVPPKEDDPDFVDPVEITPDQAERLAAILGATVDTSRFDYFVESEEDWQSVAKKIAAMRAGV
jgi:hypothetical protein